MTGFENLWRVFSSPGRVAAGLVERSGWKLPVIVVVGASIVLTLVMMPYQMEARREMLEKYAKESGREIDVEEALKPTVGRSVAAVVGAVIAVVLFVLASAAILNGASMLAGGRSGFSRMFSFFSYVMVIPAVGNLIKIPLILLKKSYDVRLSLGAFFPAVRAESPAGILLGSTDLFSIWAVAATVIGFGVLTQLGGRKSAAIVIGLYAAFVLILLGLGMLAAAVTGK